MNTLGSVSLNWAWSQPMVSTGATMRARMRLIVSYASRQRAGAGCGVSRAVGIGLGLRGDAFRLGLGPFDSEFSGVLVVTTSVFTSTFTTLDFFGVLGGAGTGSSSSSEDWGGFVGACAVEASTELSFSLLERRTDPSEVFVGSKIVTLALKGLG